MKLDQTTLAVAEAMKSWRPEGWKRYVDPLLSEGKLSVILYGSRYHWRVESRAINDTSNYPRMEELAKGDCSTLEAAQAAAEAAWIAEFGPDRRVREIAIIRDRIAQEEAKLQRLTGEPVETQETANV